MECTLGNVKISGGGRRWIMRLVTVLFSMELSLALASMIAVFLQANKSVALQLEENSLGHLIFASVANFGASTLSFICCSVFLCSISRTFTQMMLPEGGSDHLVFFTSTICCFSLFLVHLTNGVFTSVFHDSAEAGVEGLLQNLHQKYTQRDPTAGEMEPMWRSKLNRIQMHFQCCEIPHLEDVLWSCCDFTSHSPCQQTINVCKIKVRKFVKWGLQLSMIFQLASALIYPPLIVLVRFWETSMNTAVWSEQYHYNSDGGGFLLQFGRNLDKRAYRRVFFLRKPTHDTATNTL